MPQSPINKNKLLLVEGKDELNFFSALFKHLSISNIQIIEVGGKIKFKDELPALMNDPNFPSVRSLGYVRDADVNANDTLKSIQGTLKKYNLPVPKKSEDFANNDQIKIGIFILPGLQNEGMLENLCLETVSDHTVMPCINQFLECIEKKSKEPPKNKSKAKAHSFLAAMPESDLRVGEAAKKGYWNFNHSALQPLTVFLKKLAE